MENKIEDNDFSVTSGEDITEELGVQPPTVIDEGKELREDTEYFHTHFEKRIGNKIYFINGAHSERCPTADGYLITEPDKEGKTIKMFFNISPLEKMRMERAGMFTKFT
jgi:hypothetical protein